MNRTVLLKAYNVFVILFVCCCFLYSAPSAHMLWAYFPLVFFTVHNKGVCHQGDSVHMMKNKLLMYGIHGENIVYNKVCLTFWWHFAKKMVWNSVELFSGTWTGGDIEKVM